MITEDKINANYLKFIQYLEKYNCYSEQMITEIGDKIKIAPYSAQLEFGGAEPGGLIDVTLNTLCRIGAEINQYAFGNNGNIDKPINHPLLCVNQNMLMKVLLLINISKVVSFVPNDSTWHKEKLGKMYNFIDFNTRLKLGQRSIYLCQKYGITLEEEEFEAFLALDNISIEDSESYHSPLYILVKSAIMFTSTELYKKQKNNTIKNIIEN